MLIDLILPQYNEELVLGIVIGNERSNKNQGSNSKFSRQEGLILNNAVYQEGVTTILLIFSWKIMIEKKRRPYAKQPVGFKVINTPPTTLICLQELGAITYERTHFATKNILMTPYSRDQQYPDGYNMYQAIQIVRSLLDCLNIQKKQSI
ncbi:hypothetical protein BDA99DRAFT_556584 [Phascolomyces articulosus]|uniref:Uncharacterized protein n=1 Tax=Phascolomyces articulosus TaxID=60185 RepID=A0AAD5PHM9_9FUNG|nr:hypothetical protein BDA99DRAFT_556584 [Phascolomyces articulosus]